MSCKRKLPRRTLDIRLAVAWGNRLNLVVAHGDALRFPHSIMQAYLGSRFMRTALEDPNFFKDASVALKHPGREFLIALVLYCRKVTGAPDLTARRELEAPGTVRQPITAAPVKSPLAQKTPRSRSGAAKSLVGGAPPEQATEAVTAPATITVPAPAAPAPSAPPAVASPAACSDVRFIRDLLKRCAHGASDAVKALGLYAAALEIDSFLDKPDHDRIAASVATDWKDIQGGDQRTLDEAKLGLVYRFGDAVRTIADRRKPQQPRASRPGNRVNDLPEPAYLRLFEIGCLELSHPIRLAAAQEIGAGGDEAFRILHDQLDNTCRTATRQKNSLESIQHKKHRRRGASAISAKASVSAQSGEDTNGKWRDRTISAWLAPLLVGSVDECREEAQQILEQWLQWVSHNDSGRAEDRLPLSVEAALAQGFKHAANRRRRHPHARPEARVYLAEQAMEMLKGARFWFSQLTLIHALCLWEMPEPDPKNLNNPVSRSHGDAATKRAAHRRGSNPEAIVRDWLETARNGKHPFVAAAGELAVRALQTGQPERFLWIDESGIVAKVGSRPAQRIQYRKHNLWIPPSTGWASLEPRAQQLIADVLLLLNLAERGEAPQQVEQRLKRTDGIRLPPCLTGDRYPLDPKRTVGAADMSAPGTNCKDGCSFKLCPYPPNGVQLHRAELSEAFSRRQQTLLGKGLRSKAAPWQASTPANLKDFWAQMADRARGGSTSPELD